MSKPPDIGFGDHVRVRSTADTEACGLAGLVGQVYGETTPSVTGIEVIGTLTADYAVNVYFAERKTDAWFAPELLEFVDHAPGTEITVGDSPRKWVRDASGRWRETPRDGASGARKPWWRFW